MLVDVIPGIAGAVAGRVHHVRDHPRGDSIWLADVDLGTGAGPVQIVFGGDYKLTAGDLVPVAPPGSRAIVRRSDGTDHLRKIRVRRYRGERSHGMLCSLDELGWTRGGPNEVARLCDVVPGQRLDDLPVRRRAEVAIDWELAMMLEKEAARTHVAILIALRSSQTSMWWALDSVGDYR